MTKQILEGNWPVPDWAWYDGVGDFTNCILIVHTKLTIFLLRFLNIKASSNIYYSWTCQLFVPSMQHATWNTSKLMAKLGQRFLSTLLVSRVPCKLCSSNYTSDEMPAATVITCMFAHPQLTFSSLHIPPCHFNTTINALSLPWTKFYSPFTSAPTSNCEADIFAKSSTKPSYLHHNRTTHTPQPHQYVPFNLSLTHS